MRTEIVDTLELHHNDCADKQQYMTLVTYLYEKLTGKLNPTAQTIQKFEEFYQKDVKVTQTQWNVTCEFDEGKLADLIILRATVDA